MNKFQQPEWVFLSCLFLFCFVCFYRDSSHAGLAFVFFWVERRGGGQVGETNFLLSVPLYRKCFKCIHIGKKKKENFGFRAVTNVSTLHQKTRTLRLFSFLFRHARRETKYKTKQKHQKNINLFEEDKKCRILHISNSNLYLRNDG